MTRTRRRYRPRFIALVALAVAFVVAGTLAVSAYDAEFFIKDGPKNALVPDWIIHPAAVYSEIADTTFLVFQGTDLDPYAAAFDHGTRTWVGPIRVGEVSQPTDAHGAPALLLDNDGYLHVFFGSHHEALQHYTSAEPLTIDGWVQQPELAGSFTYPQPMLRADGTMEIFYRSGMDWVSRSTDASGTWQPEQMVIDGQGNTQWYAHFSLSESGTSTSTVNAAFLRVDYAEYLTGTMWGRHDIYYVRREGDGLWRRSEGTTVTIPVTPTSAPETLVYDSGDDNTNSVIVREDQDGHPCILFVTGSGAGPTSYEWRFAHPEADGTWSEPEVITTTDHNNDHGTFAIAPEPGGGLEAFVVTGGTKGIGTGDWDYTDDGGNLVRYTKADCDADWVLDRTVSPTWEGSVFNAPQIVANADPGERILFDEWRSGPGVSSLYALGIYLWGDDGIAGRTFPAEVIRLAGMNRSATAVAVSRESWPMGSSAVVIATGTDFPDALCGGPLAFAERGPLLYSMYSQLDAATVAEIKRLRAADPTRFKAFILGGTNAVGTGVENKLKSLGVTNITRLSGRSRYDTAAAIANQLLAKPAPPTTAVVATGLAFPDALSVSPLAAHNGWPIVLTQPSALPTATADVIGAMAPEKVFIVGGEAAVGPDVEDALPNTERLAGHTRFETARVIAERSLTEGLITRRVVMASGANYPDALVGGVYAARVRGPILLTPPDVLGEDAAAFLEDRPGKVLEVVLLGGTAAISDAVHTGAAQLIE